MASHSDVRVDRHDALFSELPIGNRTIEKSVKNGARKLKLKFSLYNKAGFKKRL